MLLKEKLNIERLSKRPRRKTHFQSNDVVEREDTLLIRNQSWTASKVPDRLKKRWIEITGKFFLKRQISHSIIGPPVRKGIINALNVGATSYMADLEDCMTPNWDNVLTFHRNLVMKSHYYDAVK